MNICVSQNTSWCYVHCNQSFHTLQEFSACVQASPIHFPNGSPRVCRNSIPVSMSPDGARVIPRRRQVKLIKAVNVVPHGRWPIAYFVCTLGSVCTHGKWPLECFVCTLPSSKVSSKYLQAWIFRLFTFSLPPSPSPINSN